MTELEKQTFDKVNALIEKNKQIEEMAKAVEQARIKATDTTNSMNYGFGGWYAKELYSAGYCKASEVAREIFEGLLKDISHGLEIARSTRKKFLHNINKNNLWVYHYDGEIKALEGMECLIAELKKKYTEGEK